MQQILPPSRLKDIAQELGVSSRAVAKILTPSDGNNTRVGKKTAESIRAAAKRLGYVPDRTAQQLGGARSHLIGVVIDSAAPQSNYRILTAIEKVAARSGHRLLIGRMHDDLKATAEYLDDFRSRRVEGVIVLSHDYPGFEAEINQLYLPFRNVVFVGLPIREGFRTVTADIAAGVREAVTHLVSLGRRRIVLFQPFSESASIKDRYRGFTEACALNALQSADCPQWLYPDVSETGIRQTVHQEVVALLQFHPETDAILAVNDWVAAYVLQALASMDLRVPEDIAVTGFDDLQLAAATLPTITSVCQRESEIAEHAFGAFIGKTSTFQGSARSLLIAPKLVIRGSTDRSKD